MPTTRTMQEQDLVAKSKNLCLQNSAGSETISEGEEYGQHGLEGYWMRLCKCNDFNVYGFFGRDRSLDRIRPRNQFEVPKVGYRCRREGDWYAAGSTGREFHETGFASSILSFL
jgi:hypothetical protein